MASKLEKAQANYDRLLHELGNRAELLEMLDHAEPDLLDEYRRAQQAHEDRQVELEFLTSEIDGIVGEGVDRIEALKAEIAEMKGSKKEVAQTIDVKKSKLAPLKKSLAGGEYDLKYAERAMAVERKKQDKAKRTEDFDKARKIGEIIKHMKIDILKRKKGLDELRRQIKAMEAPAKDLRGSFDETKERLAELQKELSRLKKARDDELLGILREQKVAKESELRNSEQQVRDALADLGEDLYDKRIDHSVLNKFYQDIDQVADLINQLQEQRS